MLHDEGTVHLCENILQLVTCVHFLQSLHELDYVVKDRLFLEKVLSMEFYDAMDRSLFYRGK